MNPDARVDERVLVLAPARGDAELSQNILTAAGLECRVSCELNALCKELAEGAGAMLLAGNALAAIDPTCILEWLNKQPGWSDLPIILLSEQGADSPDTLSMVELFGNVTVLEQPVRIGSLVSTLASALKARRRQYELRDQLEAQALLAAIIQSSGDAIVSKTLDGTILSWNEGAERLFGYSAEEAIDKPITIIIPPEHLEEERTILERLRRGERVEHFETIRVAKDGRRLNVSLTISPVRDNNGRIIGASKVARDITDSKKAEQALRESEERFRFLAETIPSIVWTAAPDGRITYVNKRWLEYCGLTADENATNSPELVLHPDDYERCMAQWAEALREGKHYEIEVRHRRHDGIYRWFMTRAVPLKDSVGGIVSWFGVTTDIHDQKEMQERLQEGDRRKDEFLATLAHELRNPLAPIRNSLQFLRLAGTGRSNGHQAAEIIERQVNQLVRLVDDLLEVSRITRGKIELRKESIELAPIIGNAVETSGPLIEAAGHRLDIKLPSEPLMLEADPVRLSQVIANLLNNAAKYTEAGGRIWLSAGRDAGNVIVSVRDNGVGIPADMLPHIFEMFAQVDGSVGRAQGGLGIGLTLAQTLVQQHGGTLEARSEGPGLGSEFIVRLPIGLADRQPESAETTSLNDTATSSTARRILIVDDNIDSAESLGMCLTLMGHEVETVHEGLAAIDKAREYKPEVVVLDIGLPDIDGYQVAERLRGEPGFDRVLLIALTGYGQEEDRQRAQSAGFDQHFVKPVDPAALEAVLSR